MLRNAACCRARRRLRTGGKLRRDHWIRTGTRGRAYITIHGPYGKLELLRTVVGPDLETSVKQYDEQAVERYRKELRGWRSRSNAGVLLDMLKGKIKVVSGALFGTRWGARIRTSHGQVGIRGTELVAASDPVSKIDTIYVRKGIVIASLGARQGVRKGQLTVVRAPR